MPAERVRARSSGFTLLEVLVALIIFAISFGALAGLFQTSLRQSTTADVLMEAVMLAETQLARFGKEWPINVGKTEGVSPGGLVWRTEVTVAGMAEEDDLALYRIKVEVGPADGSSNPVALDTLRIGSRP